MNTKRIIYSPHYARKKHRCLKCNSILRLKRVERIVNSNSKEADKYDFYAVDGYLYGDVKFIMDEFKCTTCDFQIMVSTYKQIERAISLMEKRDSRSLEDESYEYIYNKSLKEAFYRRWYCKECDRRILPTYELVDSTTRLSISEKFRSFNCAEFTTKSDELRKLHCECPKCKMIFELKDINGNYNIKKESLKLKIANILILIVLLLLYVKFC